MSRITLLATGDVAPRRADLAGMFAGVAPLLRTGDIVFGQLETTLSDRGSPLPQARLAMRTDPAAAKAIRDAGYSVMSLAGNHCLDFGAEALADTLTHAQQAGLAVCGAGPTIAAARAPAIVECQGIKVAFLAYSSILPQDYWAQESRGGCAPMRGHTLFEQIETDQPGTPARVHTFPHREDLEALRNDVRNAKKRADFVAISVHWGIHFVPSEIAGYQRDIAHAAIDEGCGAVFGHHPHILKGIEVYKGAPVFYSLGNFAIEQPQAFDEDILQTNSFADLSALNPDMDATRAFVMPADSQKTMIAALTFEDGALTRIAYRPCQIDDASQPHLLTAADPRWPLLVDYVSTISAEQGLLTHFSPDGDEVVVTA